MTAPLGGPSGAGVVEGGSSGVQISFDENNNLRVLPEERFGQGQKLHAEAEKFSQKVAAFSQSVGAAIEALDRHAGTTDQERLKAIGARNMRDLIEARTSAVAASARLALQERSAELSRLQTYLVSLEKIERDQLAMIERLTSEL